MPGKQLSDSWNHSVPVVIAAYEVCREIEERLMSQLGPSTTRTTTGRRTLEKQLVNIRILGHFLTVGPTDVARGRISRTILTDLENGPDAVINRGGFYDQLFLRSFRKAKGPTPRVSHHSRPSCSITLAEAARAIKKNPTNHKEARKSALFRDNFRCIASGAIDHHSWAEYSEVREQASEAARIAKTECVYIFSESMNAGIHEDSMETEYARNAWTIIRGFGYEEIYDELASENGNIHRLQNIMTLDASFHDLFDTLDVWFEETDTPNLYKICSSIPGYHKPARVPEYVEFRTERRDLPLPSPRYLEIHAACCRVAHMSGAADYYRDLDDDDPFETKVQSLDPVGPDFSAALHARLLDLSEWRAATAGIV